MSSELPRPKILLIDDDAPFRAVISKALTKSGCAPIEAQDAEAGLKCARDQKPDLILCDLEMPGLDGYQCLAELQRQKETASIPVILVTGRTDAVFVRLGMNLGADDYIVKPVDLQDLISAIRTRLRRAEQHSAKISPHAPVHERREPTFLVPVSHNKCVVKSGQIQAILADGEYSWVHWTGGKRGLVRKSLKLWMIELPADCFVRVHRRAIINLAHIERIDAPAGRETTIILSDNLAVPVSLRCRSTLNRKLRGFRQACGSANPTQGTAR